MSAELFGNDDSATRNPQSAISSPVLSEAQHGAACLRLNPRGKGKLGRRLPESPAELHALLGRLVGLLRANEAAGGSWVDGGRIADHLGLHGPRSVRQLVSYARFAYGIREIVALPGQGYRWGGADPEVYQQACELADRFGRDWFAISRIYGGNSTAMAFAQRVFDWFPSFTGQFSSAMGEPRRQDELSRLIEADSATVGEVLDAMLEFMTQRPEVYGEDLSRIARKHAAVLVSRADAERLALDLEATARKVRGLVGVAV